MAIFDKVKNQAAGLADRAQKAAQSTARAGQAKFDEVQAKRKNDARLRELGAAVYAKHQGTADAETEASIERLIGEIAAYEASGGSVEEDEAGEETTEAD